MIDLNNKFTAMQKKSYAEGTNNHEHHNENPDYWDILLSDLKDTKKWNGKNALDFACGKGRNVTNLINLCNWNRVDGIDISQANIDYCKQTYTEQNSEWYCNNGIDLSDLKDDEYDFAMFTIALQHIPVYDIRYNIFKEIHRSLKSGGLFSFQMGYGDESINSLHGETTSYYENNYDALNTNGANDVRITDENQIIDDLEQIGFKILDIKIEQPWNDGGHPNWIYFKAKKI